MAAEESEDGAEELPLPEIAPVVSLHQMPDPNLLALVHMSDFVGFPLTLYLPWGVVAGHTGSPNTYYKHLAEQARAGTAPADAPDGWAEMIDEFAEANFDAYSNVPPAERVRNGIEQGFDLTSYIILKDANCWVGSFTSPIEHEYLRVRLIDVTAWAWGKYSRG